MRARIIKALGEEYSELDDKSLRVLLAFNYDHLMPYSVLVEKVERDNEVFEGDAHKTDPRHLAPEQFLPWLRKIVETERKAIGVHSFLNDDYSYTKPSVTLNEDVLGKDSFLFLSRHGHYENEDVYVFVLLNKGMYVGHPKGQLKAAFILGDKMKQ